MMHFVGIDIGTSSVYSAIGDNQASFLGSVQDINTSIHITIGTSSQISVYSEKYIEIESLDTRPFPGGGYILVGAALCGGQSFSILREVYFPKLLNIVQEIFKPSCIYAVKVVCQGKLSCFHTGKLL